MISADGRVFAGGCGRSTGAVDGATVIVGVCCWRNAKPRPASTAMVSSNRGKVEPAGPAHSATLGSKPCRNLIGYHGLPFVRRTPQVRLHLIGGQPGWVECVEIRHSGVVSCLANLVRNARD